MSIKELFNALVEGKSYTDIYNEMYANIPEFRDFCKEVEGMSIKEIADKYIQDPIIKQLLS